MFILESLKLIRRSYDNISKTLFIPYPTPKLVKTSHQSSLFLNFFENFKSSKSCLIRFEIRFPKICFKKFINFELSSQVYIKIKKLDYLFKISNFSLITYKKKQLTWGKKFRNCYLFAILLLLVSAIFLILTAFFGHYFCDRFCVYFYLFGRFKPLKSKLYSDWIRQLEQKWAFLWLETTMPKMELCFSLDTTFIQEFHKRKLKSNWTRVQSKYGKSFLIG